MPFNTSLVSGDYTKLRAKWYGEQYALFCPNQAVFQCQPLANSVGVYASIEYTNVTIGDYEDIEAGQAFIVTTSDSDFSEPLFRGRIRKEATSDFLFITITGFELTTSHYVTVLDTYDIASKVARVLPNGETRIDYDVAFQQLPPVVKDLQSSYVVNTTSASSSIAFTPDATATADGASIDSWLWDVKDGTITIGSTTTQDITVSFPQGHRWVRLTVTDDNGVSNYFVFEVYVVDLSDSADLPSTAKFINSCDIQASADTGYNATFSTIASATMLEDTRVTIVTLDNYNGTQAPISTNIDFVGYLKRDDSSITGSLYGYDSQTTFTCNGFAEQLANVSISSMLIVDNDTPTAWGQVIAPTAGRATAFLMAYLTTFTHVSAVQFNSALDNFVTSQYSSAEVGAMDAIVGMLQSVNARLNFAPSGETDVSRIAVYLSSTDRNALATIANIDEQDYTDVQFSQEYGIVIGSVEGDGSKYDTTSDLLTNYYSRAPSITLIQGVEVAQLNEQILLANQTETNSKTELGQRVANHLAYVNPTPQINITLNPHWHFIAPSYNQWWTIVIDSDKNPRAKSYTSSDRWLLTSVSYSTDFALGTKSINAQFRLETTSVGFQSITAQVPLTIETPFAPQPIVSEYPSLDTNALINYPTDSPSDLDKQPIDAQSLGQVSSSLPAEVIAQETQGDEPNCELITLPFTSNAIKGTSFLSTLGQDYIIKINGDADIGIQTVATSFDYAIDPTQYTALSGWSFNAYSYLSFPGTPSTATFGAVLGVGGYYTQRGIAGLVFVRTRIEITPPPSTYISSLSFRARANSTSGSTGGFITVDGTNYGTQNGGYNGVSKTLTGTVNGFGNTITFDIDSIQSFATTVIEAFTINYATNSDGTNRGDAFYNNYSGNNAAQLYTSGQGLLIDGGVVPDIPPFDPSHQYVYPFTGTGNQITFQFVDPDGDYSNNSNNNLYIKVCGEGVV